MLAIICPDPAIIFPGMWGNPRVCKYEFTRGVELCVGALLCAMASPPVCARSPVWGFGPDLCTGRGGWDKQAVSSFYSRPSVSGYYCTNDAEYQSRPECLIILPIKR